MSHLDTRPQTTRPAVSVPLRHRPVHELVADALRDLPPPPGTPTWGQRLLPRSVRGVMTDLGWWQDPTTQPPSVHLQQTLAVLTKYGWCQSLDVSITGQLCIRGAQSLLEKTGHVTPQARERAVHHMQQTLAQAQITMQFFAWNDLPDLPFSSVRTLLTVSSRNARRNGE